MRRGKARFPGGCESHPAVAPAPRHPLTLLFYASGTPPPRSRSPRMLKSLPTSGTAPIQPSVRPPLPANLASPRISREPPCTTSFSVRPSPDSVRSLELRVSRADEDDSVFRRASTAKTSLHRPCLVCCHAQVTACVGEATRWPLSVLGEVTRPGEPFTRILRVVTLEDGEISMPTGTWLASTSIAPQTSSTCHRWKQPHCRSAPRVSQE